MKDLSEGFLFSSTTAKLVLPIHKFNSKPDFITEILKFLRTLYKSFHSPNILKTSRIIVITRLYI